MCSRLWKRSRLTSLGPGALSFCLGMDTLTTEASDTQGEQLMARCTAAKTGQHKRKETELACPACGPRLRDQGKRMLAPSAPQASREQWPAESQRHRRGHQFYPTKDVKIPALYETETVPCYDKEVVAHYFAGGSDWWVVEADKSSGEVFCFARINDNDDLAEWGYSSLPELEGLRSGLTIVERDMGWSPKKVRDIPEMSYKSINRPPADE